MKKLYAFLYACLVVCKLFAQGPESPGGLPQLLPVTPSAAGLIKVGMGDVLKSTGAVQVSIPLYQLKVGEVSVPIGLNYMSQGNKVE